MQILLPIDGSDCAQNTLQWVARLFKERPDVGFHLLEVVATLPDAFTAEYDLSDATETLHQAKRALEEQGCTVTTIVARLGDITEQICAYAEEANVDQVILGSHGRTGLTKLLLGSVSSAVMERCKRPVMIHRNLDTITAKHPLLPHNTIL